MSPTLPIIALIAALSISLPQSYGQITPSKHPALEKVLKEVKKDSFEGTFRTQTYEAYPTIESTAKKLKTSGYNQFENPTGIFFEPGEHVIYVGNAKTKSPAVTKAPLELRVVNFGKEWKDERYPLKPGMNVIDVKVSGTGYISYYTDDPKATKLPITIATGKVNGYFDSAKHTNEDWKKLLENAVAETLDIRGKYVQLCYSIDALKKHCPEKGKELIDIYDEIIKLEQDLMGLDKYKVRPKNRMFGRVIWGDGFMHADGLGAAFHDNTMDGLANPDKIPDNTWGIAHEFGHVNQTRPGLQWVSTTEVTNNIYSSWVNYKLNPKNVRLEHEDCPDLVGNVTGGRFNCYLISGIINGENWLAQKGPDKMENYHDGGDHFVKLAPLWQLQLYYGAALRGTNPDFYADIHQIVRHTDESKKSNGDLQLAFMKNACDVAKEDLTDFFIKSGMLKPIDKDMDDYNRGQLTITQEQCDKLVKYASKYKKPESPVLYYISANSVKAFKDKLPVEGELGKGVTGEGDTRTISHDVWKNVVVFETYEGDKLISACIVGTNHPDNSATLVRFPEKATHIEAVSWDGKRTPVYKK